MGSYVPSTPAQRREMLEAVGCASMEDLFSHLPQQVLLDRPLNLPSGLSELEVRRIMEKMAARNTVFSSVLRGARVSPLHSGNRKTGCLQRRICNRLYPLSGRNQPGCAPVYFRIPDDDLRADRYGRFQRVSL